MTRDHSPSDAEFWTPPAPMVGQDGRSYVLFWGQASPFSNWRGGSFRLDGFDYNCGEQRMMHAKAALFGDARSAERCLDAKGPWEQKRIGRSVQPYDEARWEASRFEMMLELVHAKALQDPRIGAYLIATGDAIIVEASPHDPVWGIGLAADHPDALDPSRWRGRNLLGQAWTQARELIRQGLTPARSACSLAIEAMYGPAEPEQAPPVSSAVPLQKRSP